MQSTRTFVCLELPETIRALAAALQARLATLGGQMRWVNPANLHLTLRFLGELSPPRVESVCSAVRLAAARVNSFTVKFSGTGCFPSLRRPRTFWIGVVEATELIHLFEAVEQELVSKGFPRESRPLAPHLTLGRIRTDRASAGLVDALSQAELSAALCPVQEITVMKSVLGKSGPVYTPIIRARLRHA